MLNSARRSGRRPGRTGTRAAILDSARRLFAERGFDGASLRAVAGEAGVDPALVVHFFGGKEALFAASLELPYSPEEIHRMLAGDPEQLGTRVATLYLKKLFREKAATVGSLLRSSVTNPRAAAMLRRTLEATARAIFPRLVPGAEAELRGELVASHMMGLFLARHILAVEPIASEDEDRLVELVAPTLQRYLTGPLPRKARRR
jgi:AcrR family transcriptional regulator